MGQRVVLLGTCGMCKSDVARRIRARFDALNHTLDVIDLEHDFLSVTGEKPYRSFLLDPPHEQFRQWREAWDRLRAAHDFDKLPNHTLLIMHGAIVKGQYGARAIIDLQRIADFRPNLVITLIDNVYDMWWRTENKSKGEPLRGRPTLEQLLMARRVEVLVGDLIVNNVVPRARHIVLAAEHPVECAARLILGRKHIVYLAFPISEPRRLQKGGDSSGVDMVNAFHEAAFVYQNANPDVIFISPLAVDERPLPDNLGDFERITLEVGKRRIAAVVFPRDQMRWPVDSFWHAAEVLSPGAPEAGEQAPIPVSRVEDAGGTIRTDVAWRDYRLVLQADALAVCNPVLNNKLARGVRAEIEYASQNGKSIYVYQDPSQDTKGLFTSFASYEGSMGASPLGENVVLCESVEDLLERASSP